MRKILSFKIFTLYLHRLRATIELWCNGNTADFGSVILSSNLGSSTTGGDLWSPLFLLRRGGEFSPLFLFLISVISVIGVILKINIFFVIFAKTFRI